MRLLAYIFVFCGIFLLFAEQNLHTVKDGETLSEIARAHDVSLKQLLEANEFTKAEIIHPGQDIIIPRSGEAKPVSSKQPPQKALDFSKLGATIENCHALEGFFEKIAEADKGETHTIRVLFLGDSHIYADFFTSPIRRGLQAKYGNGGRGLLIPPPPGENADQRDVDIRTSQGWKILSTARSDSTDSLYGLCMRRFVAVRYGARFEAEFPCGAQNYIELWYWAHPCGDTVALIVDVQETLFVDTYSDTATLSRFCKITSHCFTNLIIESRQKTGIKVSAATYKVKSGDCLSKIARNCGVTIADLETENSLNDKSILRPGQVLKLPNKTIASHSDLSTAPVQILGIVTENVGTGGAIVDAMGLNGAYASALNNIRSDIFEKQLQWRNPDLICVAFGTNEALSPTLTESYIERDYEQLLKRIEFALPQASVLLISPPDVSTKVSKSYNPPAKLDLVISAQRTAANMTDCAFWNQREAMGGAKSCMQWRRKGLFQTPPIHGTFGGYRLLARTFMLDLLIFDIDTEAANAF